jgi:deoxyribonuclease-4
MEMALVNAQELGVNTIQLHPSPPQRWNAKPFPPDYGAKFIAQRASSGVDKVFFHGIYLINLANPDPQQLHLSRTSLVHHLELTAQIAGDGVIFHVGTAKHAADETAALRQAAEGVNWIMENSPAPARLLLEVAAGAGSIIGDRVEELAAIYDQVEQKERVGFALDSQHLWASGYDLTNELDTIIDSFERTLAIEKIWAIHLNDSKTALASKKDRHENLGDGAIGNSTLSAFVNHPKLRHIPFILETPGLKDMETAKVEVEKLKAIAR